MSQFVIINGTEYECKASSELHYLVFTFTDKTVDEVNAIFENVTSLQIAGEDKIVYGTYDHLRFVSVEQLFNEDGSVNSVIAKLYIKSQTEIDIDNLKATQNEQDEIIATLVYGA